MRRVSEIMGEMLQLTVEIGLLRARMTVEESPSRMKDLLSC